MNQPYIVLEIAHSIHGQLRRICLTQRSINVLLCSLLVLLSATAGLLFAFARMSLKVSQYEELQAEFDSLKHRYQDLQAVSTQRRETVASLANLAHEVSEEYGIQRPGSDTALDSDTYGSTAKETIEQFNFLKSATYAGIYHRYAYKWQSRSNPNGWPVQGVIRSSFGGRSDPFSGEGAFHTGIDLQAASGTQVHVTADGVVASSGWSGNYGKLVVVDHGNGYETYYAHLSQSLVVPGEEVRQGQVIALSGATGRVTAPHLHYEVRVKGVPVNPYRFLSAKPEVAQNSKPSHNDLGL